ncbi:hypothetical protein B0H67DRAFT_500776 [Lasiosphaeris hirsuta]|uniref:Copper acquisition factor BIM1-like domain-containing protein n=1 Tax=Lasiosphaeris hirsuta TaxID=260670 RepID=A0AA40DIK8_9PEZI|nr:hypothetical protein B0H67DRAFT_500776 [Lasiosphaeris hirsuta]
MLLQLALATLATLATSHFVLDTPTSIGFEDTKEGIAPCGGFEPTSRDSVTDWTVAGGLIHVISTHPRSQFTIQAALLPSATTNSGDLVFSKLVPIVQQAGLGSLCLTGVPGIAAWEGRDAVLQVIQVATDGQLFQCAAIRFTAGPSAPVPSLCTNSSGITATYLTDSPSGTAPTSNTTSPGPAAKGSVGRLSPRAPILANFMPAAIMLAWL